MASQTPWHHRGGGNLPFSGGRGSREKQQRAGSSCGGGKLVPSPHPSHEEIEVCPRGPCNITIFHFLVGEKPKDSGVQRNSCMTDLLSIAFPRNPFREKMWTEVPIMLKTFHFLVGANGLCISACWLGHGPWKDCWPSFNVKWNC